MGASDPLGTHTHARLEGLTHQQIPQPCVSLSWRPLGLERTAPLRRLLPLAQVVILLLVVAPLRQAKCKVGTVFKLIPYGCGERGDIASDNT